MSNIYRLASHVRHYQMPAALQDVLTYIRHDELKLLHFLHSEFQRTSRSELSFPATSVCVKTGIHPTNLGKARRALVEFGLLLTRTAGKKVTYICCDPTDRTPIPDGNSNGVAIDFDSLSARVIEQYFRPRLKGCKHTSNGLSARCPFPDHRDTNPSFSLMLGDGTGGVWNCYGCNRSGKLVDFEVFMSEGSTGGSIDRSQARSRVIDRLRDLGAIEPTTGQQDDVVFAYCDEDGEVISETVRPKGDKAAMYQRRPNPDKPGTYIKDTKGCRKVLYNLPEVLEAFTVIVLEGEPDVERVRKLNLQDTGDSLVAATTVVGGAGGWLPEYSERLRNKWVILIGHNDEDGKGLRHMEEVRLSLQGRAKDIRHVLLPAEFKDVSDYLEVHPGTDLIALIGDDWLQKPVSI